jgi:hypothetical protein
MHFGDGKLKITRRGVQIALGLLWLLDGALQLQSRMFTPAFINYVIAPAAQGQPAFVQVPMQLFMHVFLLQPALFNSCAAITQLVIGALILTKRTAKIGLLASVGWGLFVWYIGEGLSGLASGHALLLMGSPGAALIYVLLALGTLPRRKSHQDQRPDYWLLVAWIVLWVVGSVYQVLPGQNTVADTSSMIRANATAAPHWLAALDNNMADYLNHFGTATTPPTDAMAGMPGMATGPARATSSQAPHSVSGFWVLLLVALFQLLIAFGVILPGMSRIIAVTMGILLSLAYWVVGQSLGAYFSGLATDPSSGPLFILLGLTVLGCTQKDGVVHQYLASIKRSFQSELSAMDDPFLR